MSGPTGIAEIRIRLPRVLTDLAGCERTIRVRGETVEAALLDLTKKVPQLAVHLYDDTGSLRRHVLCFRNDVALENRADLSAALLDGDELTLMNSVAGG